MDRIKIGLAMPMSAIGGLPAEHWDEVNKIIQDTLKGFDCCIVSEKKGEPSIYNSVATNLRDLELVICDISCRNPNVMLELGMRLGTQEMQKIRDLPRPKPVIILKDDETEVPSNIRDKKYIEYPRNLKLPDIQKFEKKLLKEVENELDANRLNESKSDSLNLSTPKGTANRPNESKSDNFDWNSPEGVAKFLEENFWWRKNNDT
jgi:hypothetical protein